MFQHNSAFLKQINKFLNIQKNGIYIDCTLGCGNYSIEILKFLSEKGRLFSFDIDPKSVLINYKKIKDNRITIINSNFSFIEKYINDFNLSNKINGVIFDLGLSSYQLDDFERGFSFLNNGPLDMRMNQNEGISAEYWLKYAGIKDMFSVFRKYGEERYAKKIAKKIIFYRKNNILKYTFDLVKIIRSVVKKNCIKSFARIFQSIRIFINDELNSLINGLNAAYNILSSKGRLVVVTFHSLEDRIVKNFIKKKSDIMFSLLPDLPLTNNQINKKYFCKMKNLGRYKPSKEDINLNNRIRSAILRVAEKI